MKVLLTILIIIGYNNESFSQSAKKDTDRKRITIQLFESTNKVYPLIKIAADSVHQATGSFVFRATKEKYDCLIQLFQIKQKDSDFVLDPTNVNHAIWGYSKYKRCTVFIAGDKDEAYKFFTRTTKVRSFNFISFPVSAENLLKDRSYSHAYTYINGKFYPVF